MPLAVTHLARADPVGPGGVELDGSVLFGMRRSKECLVVQISFY